MTDFGRKKPDTISDAKVALEQAINKCHRAGMDDTDIRKYVSSYLTAMKH